MGARRYLDQVQPGLVDTEGEGLRNRQAAVIVGRSIVLRVEKTRRGRPEALAILGEGHV
jgi:hypothetical protein